MKNKVLNGLVLVLVTGLGLGVVTVDGLEVPGPLSSGAVLQRDGAVLWGKSTCGQVRARVLGNGNDDWVSSQVDQGGLWKVRLSPQPASWNKTVELEDCQGKKVFKNVNFGDVFLCSGQSNMEFTVYEELHGKEAIASSGDVGDGIRFWSGLKNKVKEGPIFDPPSRHGGGWLGSWPQNFDTHISATFWPSAICYFTVRNLYWFYNGTIPMGFVDSAYGGQIVEEFSSPNALSDTSCGGLGPGFGETDEQDLELGAMVDDGWEITDNLEDSTDCPSCIWNGQIAPLMPMRFKAVMWYQGESNANKPSTYACRFAAMITDWRRSLGQLPFVYVLLAGYRPDHFPPIRTAQLDVLKLPSTAIASALDHGDPTNIHPKNKQPVARRVFLEILKLSYNVWQAPNVPIVSVPPQALSAPLTLDVLEVQSGGIIELAGTDGCTVCCSKSPFSVWDGSSWTQPRAKVYQDRRQVVVDVPGSSVKKIRFNQEDFPECTLRVVYQERWNVSLPVFPFEYTVSVNAISIE